MRTVVHVVSADESEQETALAIAENLLDDESGEIDGVAVVAQADGIEAVLEGGDRQEDVRSLLDRGVQVSACENSLDTMDLDEADLVAGIETVPEGAVEVTRLQEEGYAYLRP